MLNFKIHKQHMPETISQEEIKKCSKVPGFINVSAHPTTQQKMI